MTKFDHISLQTEKDLQFTLNAAIIFSRSEQNRINTSREAMRNATVATSICRFKQLRKTFTEEICDQFAAEQAA